MTAGRATLLFLLYLVLITLAVCLTELAYAGKVVDSPMSERFPEHEAYMKQALEKLHKANALISVDSAHPWLMDSARNNEIQKRIRNKRNFKGDPNL